MTLSSLGAHSQTILKDNYRSVLAAQRMKDALERLEDQSAILLLTEKREGVFSQMAQHQQQLEAELAVQEGNITEPGEAELTKRLRALWIRYQEKLATLALGRIQEAEAFYFAELEPAFAVKTAADGLSRIKMVLHKVIACVALPKEEYYDDRFASISLIGFWLSTISFNRLPAPSRWSQTTRQLGEGDFVVRANVQGTDDAQRVTSTRGQRFTEYRNSSLANSSRNRPHKRRLTACQTQWWHGVAATCGL
jgi:hypothetical protein